MIVESHSYAYHTNMAPWLSQHDPWGLRGRSLTVVEYVFRSPSDMLGMGTNRYLSLCRQPPADDGWPLFFGHVGLQLGHPRVPI